MPTTTDDEDFQMTGRLANLFRQNPGFAKDYFAKGTHGGHSSVEERNRHDRHVEAVQHVQDLLKREQAAQRARGMAYVPVASRQATDLEIRKAMSDPAYADGRHKDHADAVARVSYLYKQLNP